VIQVHAFLGAVGCMPCREQFPDRLFLPFFPFFPVLSSPVVMEVRTRTRQPVTYRIIGMPKVFIQPTVKQRGKALRKTDSIRSRTCIVHTEEDRVNELGQFFAGRTVCIRKAVQYCIQMIKKCVGTETPAKIDRLLSGMKLTIHPSPQ